jgi:hypothetical protein
MSTPEEEALSYEHEHSTYAPATPDPEHVDDNMTNPPPGPSVEQTRGVPVDEGGAAQSQSRSKTAAKKDE